MSRDTAPEPHVPAMSWVAELLKHDAAQPKGGSISIGDSLLDALYASAENDWLECARALILRGDSVSATHVLTCADAAYPDAADIRLALAGMLQQTGRAAHAEDLLRALLIKYPENVAARFLLARSLMEQGRTCATAELLRALFTLGRHDVGIVIRSVEMLDECNRKQDAAAICEAEISAGCGDPRIHAYAGMLQIQLGNFSLARQRYEYVLANSPDALEWDVTLGLSQLQRYAEREHPDFALFQEILQRADLSDKARKSTLFALAKACDDIGDYAQAATALLRANELARAVQRWSRKQWRRQTAARMCSAPHYPFRRDVDVSWTPLFVVGVPRSGTTLVAELLTRHARVCNRGELNWLPRLAAQLDSLGPNQIDLYKQAAAIYEAQLRQDDSDADWFIDKQPLNLLHVDLILALWPNARIIYCRRSPRDTALSLWSQSFRDNAQGYAYDLADIAAVIQGCDRLMAHWQSSFNDAIHTIRYERLTAAPTETIAALAAWLGLPTTMSHPTNSSSVAISTASLWQARQPVYTRSVGRWQHYAPYVPELRKLSAN